MYLNEKTKNGLIKLGFRRGTLAISSKEVLFSANEINGMLEDNFKEQGLCILEGSTYKLIKKIGPILSSN